VCELVIVESHLLYGSYAILCVLSVVRAIALDITMCYLIAKMILAHIKCGHIQNESSRMHFLQASSKKMKL
jgi:hypothetical protein